MSSMNICGGTENELEGGGTEFKLVKGDVNVYGKLFK